nr:ATP-binding cassette domain-containing protein [Thioalkalivibrio sp. ALE20]
MGRVGLADRAGQRADTLSGGQQQRVAIARMLMQAPRLVLADEPVASLDPRSGREVMDLLWEIVREEGMTVVCTLHQLDLAREYGDRLLGMKAGKIQLQGQIDDFDTSSLESLYQGEVRVDADPRAEAPLAATASTS